MTVSTANLNNVSFATIGGASAALFSPLSTAGAVTFGLAINASSNTLGPFIQQHLMSSNIIVRLALHILPHIGMAFAVAAALYPPLALKTCLIITGAHVVGIAAFFSIVFMIEDAVYGRRVF